MSYRTLLRNAYSGVLNWLYSRTAWHVLNTVGFICKHGHESSTDGVPAFFPTYSSSTTDGDGEGPTTTRIPSLQYFQVAMAYGVWLSSARSHQSFHSRLYHDRSRSCVHDCHLATTDRTRLPLQNRASKQCQASDNQQRNKITSLAAALQARWHRPTVALFLSKASFRPGLEFSPRCTVPFDRHRFLFLTLSLDHITIIVWTALSPDHSTLIRRWNRVLVARPSG